ncbi:ComF family protein [Cellulomonas hominis]
MGVTRTRARDEQAEGVPEQRVRGWPPWLRAVLGELVRLVLPVACAGCGRPDVALCRRCAALLSGPPVRCEAGADRLDRLDGRPPLPVWAVAANTGAVRQIVIGWKDRGQAELGPVLTGVAARLAREVAPSLRAAVGPAPPVGGVGRGDGADAGNVGGGGADGSGPVLLVVPAPSTAAARRRRGGDLVGQLASAVAAELRAAGVDAVAAGLLRRRSGGADQVGLGARARGSNLVGRVRLRRSAAYRLPGAPVLLVDDVLTTGATLAVCADLVEAAGAVALGAVTLAATPRPGRTGQWLVTTPAGD